MKIQEVSTAQLIKQLSKNVKLPPVEIKRDEYNFSYFPARRKLVERHLLEQLVKNGESGGGYQHASHAPVYAQTPVPRNRDLYELLNSIVSARIKYIVKLHDRIMSEAGEKNINKEPLWVSEEGRQTIIEHIVQSELYIYPVTEQEQLKNENKRGKQKYVAENSQVARAIHELQQYGRTDLELVSEYLSET